MAHVQRKLILTGGRAGKTVSLGGFQFVDGYTMVEGQPVDVEGKCIYLGRVYKAFPEGSRELEYYQEQDRRLGNGASQAHQETEQRHPDSLPGGVQSSGGGPAETSTSAGERAADTEARSERVPSSGDRHEHSRDDRQGIRGQRIRQALAQLDPKNEQHWTALGQPRMDVLEALYGSADIVRSDVLKVAPNFSRNNPTLG